MKIHRFVFNPLQENTYILWDDTSECVTVDAGNLSAREDRALSDFIEAQGLKPVAAVNTHGHFDHLAGASYVCATYGVPFAMSSKDAFLLAAASQTARMYGVETGETPSKIDIDLDASDSFTFGNTTLRVIPVPGHTPGHVALFEPDSGTLLSGDTLFRESIGRTDLAGGDYSWIMRSILEKIMPLGDEVRVLPGHGEETTIGHESLYNPFIVEVLNDEVNYR
ncbi:MAG: MBL fold metallo-hydrolase [Alistipes sp.]|nr:MBL fold metallo-hydrolase [Alistipes sp.]